MTVKEKIRGEIDELKQNELVLIYEQIKWIKKVRRLDQKSKNPISLEELHRYTSSSKSSWAADVVRDREDRV